MTPIHYRDADAFIIVFSLTDRDSFDAVKEYWIPSIHNYGP
jgi:GTPase SAR1 family protein